MSQETKQPPSHFERLLEVSGKLIPILTTVALFIFAYFLLQMESIALRVSRNEDKQLSIMKPMDVETIVKLTVKELAFDRIVGELLRQKVEEIDSRLKKTEGSRFTSQDGEIIRAELRSIRELLAIYQQTCEETRKAMPGLNLRLAAIEERLARVETRQSP